MDPPMPRRNRYLIAVLLLILVSALFGYLWRDTPSAQPTLPAHSYAKALRQAHDGRQHQASKHGKGPLVPAVQTHVLEQALSWHTRYRETGDMRATSI